MPRYRIPVRVIRSKDAPEEKPDAPPPVSTEAVAQPVPAQKEKAEIVPFAAQDEETARGEPQSVQHTAQETEETPGFDWRDRALRLQAEIETLSKRKQRLAQEQIYQDRAQLLTDILSVADNLDRALSVADPDSAVRQGVELTRKELLRVLSKYDVERIAAQDQPFDPNWHQAVGVTSAQALGVAPDSVIQIVRAGYRLGERLLRPAHVIVAQ